MKKMTSHARAAMVFLWLLLAVSSRAQPPQPNALTVGGWQENEVNNKYGQVMTGTEFNVIAERVFRRLLNTPTARGGPQLPYEVTLLTSEEINAMSDAKGKVYVFKGILPLLGRDEGVWAALLGHEIAHVIEGHSYQRMLRAYQTALARQNLTYQAQMGNPAAAWALLFQGAAGPLINLKLTRDEEAGADHLGLTMMAEAGYHPDNAAVLCQRMTKAVGNASKLETFLTHDHPRWVTREENVWRNWSETASRFSARWGDPAKSPGGTPPAVARFDKGNAKEDKKNKVVRISLPYSVRNARNAIVAVSFLHQNTPVAGAIAEYRFSDGTLGVVAHAQNSNGTEFFELTATIPAAALETKERKLQALGAIIVDGQIIQISQPFEAKFPKR